MTQSIVDLIFIAVSLLLGTENVDFIFYEPDPDWWAVRLGERRN